jgi:hypothetical protein
MGVCASIFLDVNLPNTATWFYFSLLLAVALFFKFSRLLSMRNLDLALAFLPVPGLLLILEGGLGKGGSPDSLPLTSRWGFAWLLVVSLLLLARCLFDLVLERRPALAPNLSPGGLVWLACALFVSLIVVAAREPRTGKEPGGNQLPVIGAVKSESEQHLGSGQETERILAVVCHLAVVAGLFLIGWRHFRDAHAGAALSAFYLLLPYTYLLLPDSGSLRGQWHHVWPGALVTWAVVCYRRPALAGLLLGVAAASVYHPVLIFPAWLGFYWRRGGGRFTAAFALGAGLCFIWLLVRAWLRSDVLESFSDVWALEVRDWLPWARLEADDPPSFWSGFHWAYRMPVFLLYVVLLGATAFWPSPKNLAHLIALSAAMLLGAQLWYADRGGMHVLWYLPLLLLLAFRPNLTECQAPPIVPGTDWLHRLHRLLGRLRLWLVGQPSSPVSTRN